MSLLETAADAKDDASSSSALVPTKNLLKGMKIRDEFICPITYELMREPYIATDGHTYEKSAIEKWLKNNNTSPRSGEPLESTIIIPNINLKKLIQDIINEVSVQYHCRVSALLIVLIFVGWSRFLYK